MTNSEPKKVLVLDLDNTLWGGVLGEEGAGGIALGMEAPGSFFIAFQQAIADVHQNGILLAINSKNTENVAMEVIRTHPNMILKEDHFTARRINWEDKVENMRSLADELGLGLDSFVFLDDDPVNRDQMRAMLPEVATPDLPGDPREYAKFFSGLPYFSSTITTEEDKMRGNLYVTERLRVTAEREHQTKEDFLATLGLEVTLFQNNTDHIARLSQLTGKTNQFNMDKRPLTEDEVKGRCVSEEYEVIYASAKDIYGDYGIIALAIAKKEGASWTLETFLASCRALGRGIEEAFFTEVASLAGKAGAGQVHIPFTKAERNAPAKKFRDTYTSDGTCAIDQAPTTPSWITTLWKN